MASSNILSYEKKFIHNIENTEAFCIVMVHKLIPIFEEFLKESDFSRFLILVFSLLGYLCSNLFIFLNCFRENYISVKTRYKVKSKHIRNECVPCINTSSDKYPLLCIP